MTGRDRGSLALFFGLSLWLWLRDRSWFGSASDTLPILAGLPLFYRLAGPWNLLPESAPLPQPRLFLIALLFLLGLVLEANLLLTLALVALAATYLQTRLSPASLSRARALLPLVLFSYPWLVLDGAPLTWWFRLTGASATATVFSLLGLTVERAGVHLTIQGLDVSVDPACAGLNVLQAALLAGFAVAAYNDRVRSLTQALPTLLGLFALAWVANAARIVLLCVIALTFGVELARGPLHAGGGLVVLLLMFALTLKLFARRQGSQKEPV